MQLAMHLLVLACSFVLAFTQQHRIPVVSGPNVPDAGFNAQNGDFQHPIQRVDIQQPQGQMNIQPLPSSQFTNGQQPIGPSANVHTPLLNAQGNLNPNTLEGTADVQTPLGNGHINGRPIFHPQPQPMQPVLVDPMPGQPQAAAQVLPRPGGQSNNQLPQQQRTLPCGFSCSRQSTLLMMLDGQFSSAACSDTNANLADRCENCCGSIALVNGIEKTWSAGFASTNGKDCICCINKRRC